MRHPLLETDVLSKVGDLYMNLSHTYELDDVNPFDYTTELQRHADVT